MKFIAVLQIRRTLHFDRSTPQNDDASIEKCLIGGMVSENEIFN